METQSNQRGKNLRPTKLRKERKDRIFGGGLNRKKDGKEGTFLCLALSSLETQAFPFMLVSSVRIYPEFEVDSSKGGANRYLDDNPRSEQVPSASLLASIVFLPLSAFVCVNESFCIPIGRRRGLFTRKELHYHSNTSAEQSKSDVVGNDSDKMYKKEFIVKSILINAIRCGDCSQWMSMLLHDTIYVRPDSAGCSFSACLQAIFGIQCKRIYLSILTCWMNLT